MMHRPTSPPAPRRPTSVVTTRIQLATPAAGRHALRANLSPASLLDLYTLCALCSMMCGRLHGGVIARRLGTFDFSQSRRSRPFCCPVTTTDRPWASCSRTCQRTQPCIPPGSLNRVPALIGRGKDGNVASAGWRVTLFR